MGALGLLLLLVATRVAIRQLPWFGPWLADSLRSMVGQEAVTSLEQLWATLEDDVKRVLGARSPPRSLEQAEAAPDPARPLAPQTPAARPPSPDSGKIALRLADVGPMNPRVAAKSDGVWQPVVDPAQPAAPPLLFATLLHPDGKRSWSEVFTVAIDLSRVRLYAVAGTREPEATTSAGRDAVRSGVIPAEHQALLLAAFNGGFMTRHGHHGMRVGGVTLVPPQSALCTVLGLRDAVQIGSWKSVRAEAEGAEREGRFLFFRQAAPCMLENGELNPLLRDENVRNWGATIDGKVVIRRSAIGLNQARNVLYMAVSNDTTATAIAQAMQHAGATDVAQLDVNWSYPKFLVFPANAEGQRYARSLFEGFVFHDDEYVRRPAPRDFFYLVRRDAP
jgi:hypothetical protein